MPGRGRTTGPSPNSYHNPAANNNHKASASYVTGSHNFKAGGQWNWGPYRRTRVGNGDLVQRSLFDYTPDDCLAFHAAIEQHVVPVVRRALEICSEVLGRGKGHTRDEHDDPLGLRDAPQRIEQIGVGVVVAAAVVPQIHDDGA